MQATAFKYLDSSIIVNGRCTPDIRSRLSQVKVAFSEKLLTVVSLEMRKQFICCFIWAICIYASEVYILRKAEMSMRA